MSFYVLEVAKSKWKDNISVDVIPYRITWENQESGCKLCNLFIKLLIDNDDTDSEFDEKPETKVGFHFYKYDELFDFHSTSRDDRPPMISNVYVPSKTTKKLDISKIVSYALLELETVKNGKNLLTRD